MFGEQPIKRETGENPVRSRHCKERVHFIVSLADSREGEMYDDVRVRRPARDWSLMHATGN